MQSPIKHIVIVAGEESGDAHAAAFIRELKAHDPLLAVSGIGGQHMQQAGAQLISDLARYGVTGITEVIRHLPVIKQAFNAIKAHLNTTKPDLLILVDYPGFNLRLAKYAKQVLGIRIVYYISPQIWAWKASRIDVIRAYVDHMAVILPFEKTLYQRAGVTASFVGHPLVEKMKGPYDNSVLRKQLGLPINKRLVALLPGSRTNEIKRHMPVMLESAERLSKKFADLHFVIPIAGTINPKLITAYFKNCTFAYTCIVGQSIETQACSDCVIVASGTASLESALLEKPMCIIYKASLLTYLAAAKLVKVKYLGLCNLLQNEMIVPELLQYDCNAQELTQIMSELLQEKDVSQRMIQRLHQLKLSLSASQADCTIAELIIQELENINLKKTNPTDNL